MSDSWRKLIISTIVCFALSFGLVLLSSIFGFTLEQTLADFQWDWIMAQTWSEFLEIVPIAQAWAVLITFSLVIPMRTGGRAGTSFERFGSSIITLLIFTLIFTAAYGATRPQAVRTREDLDFSTAVARSLMDAGVRAMDEQDYEHALQDFTQYVVIVGNDEAVRDRMREARREAGLDAANTRPEGGGVRRGDRGEPGDWRELTERARLAMENEDYSTAYYLATLALTLEPESDEAARIAAESLNRLGAVVPDEEETEAAALFRAKQAAREATNRGDVIDAYYQWVALNRDHPGDADISRHLAQATEKVQSLSAFLDDVVRALSMPGTGSFAFVNSSDETTREIVSVGKLVRVPTGVYARNVEVMRFNLDGELLYHLSSDYAKLVDGSFVFTVVDPDSPAGILRPTVHHGTPALETESILPIAVTAEDLWLIGVASATPAAASVTDLVRTTRSLSRFGLVTEPVESEVLFRLALPFISLMFSILVMGFSWRYRSRYLARPPLSTWIVVLLAPLVLIPVYLGFQYAHRILFSALLLWTSLGTAIGGLVVVEGILLTISLMYLALSTRE